MICKFKEISTMPVLFKKEISNFFSSATGPVVIAVFLLLTGSFLWLLPGEGNVLQSGYASVDGLFALAPWLYLFLIPALTMHLFSEEYRSGTMELLLSKPLPKYRIVLEKYLAGWILAVLALLPTLLYLICVCRLGLPASNMDFGGFWGSFLGLILLAAVYASIGVFASSLSKNSIVSFVTGATLSFVVYYGFDLLSMCFEQVQTQDVIASFGLASHYESMSRGVIDTRDLAYFLSVIVLFLIVTSAVVGRAPFCRQYIIAICAVVALDVVSVFLFTRFDLTSEKRYTLSSNSRELLENLDKPVDVTIYLDGDMNVGFLRLKKGVRDLMQDMQPYAGSHLAYRFVNPSDAASDKERNENYARLQACGLKATVVHDRDSEGNMLQKVVFPWALVAYGNDTIPVNLLSNVQGNSGDENLNLSIESLEYQFTDALRILSNKNPERIAFLEGHGEWGEDETYDITSTLSKYYFVDRGAITDDASVLDAYKVVIIAAPIARFSEREKFVLDQYLMRGGRILWLVDGVRTDKENVGIANELGLDDMMFNYGVRINPVLVLDAQCSIVPINVAQQGEQPQFQAAPFYYSPLLLNSQRSVITRNLTSVKADFASMLEFVGERDSLVSKSVILATSNRTGVEVAPMPISMDIVELSAESPFFQYSYLPVGALLEGQFNSAFATRMVPDSLHNVKPIARTSSATKMIVVADGDVIRNDVQGYGADKEYLPLGYDRYMQRQFGNGDFIQNCVNYLADDSGWMELRGRELKLRLLDKQAIHDQRLFWQIFNMVAPILLIAIAVLVFRFYRSKKYANR